MIIAQSSKVDLSFVMAFQTMRFVLVLAAGLPLSRFVARSIDRKAAAPVIARVQDAELRARIKEDEGELD